MRKEINECSYEAPRVEVIEVMVEKGFASTEGGFTTPDWKPEGGGWV